MSYEKRLAAMRDMWAKGREGGASTKVPPGTYEAKLVLAELGESQSSSKLQIHREHVISEGEYQGESVHDYLQLETDRGPFFIELWLGKLGYDVNGFDPVSLEATLKEVNERNPQCRIKVVHSNGFVNVRLLNLIEDGAGGEPLPEAEPEAVPEAEPEAEPEAVPEAKPENAPEGGEDEGQLLADLTSLAQTFSVDTDEADTVETLTEKLSALEWHASDLEEHEKAALDRAGIKVIPAKGGAAPAKAAPAKPPAAKPPAAKASARAPAKPPMRTAARAAVPARKAAGRTPPARKAARR